MDLKPILRAAQGKIPTYIFLLFTFHCTVTRVGVHVHVWKSLMTQIKLCVLNYPAPHWNIIYREVLHRNLESPNIPENEPQKNREIENLSILEWKETSLNYLTCHGHKCLQTFQKISLNFLSAKNTSNLHFFILTGTLFSCSFSLLLKTGQRYCWMSVDYAVFKLLYLLFKEEVFQTSWP